MEEKFTIINNGNLYHFAIKCNRQTLQNYLMYGKNATKPDGIINITELSNWLISHNVPYRVIIGNGTKAIIIRLLLAWHIRIANKYAKKKGMFIPTDELKNALELLKSGDHSMFWYYDEKIESFV